MFEGLIYQLVYNLERHRLFNVRLRRWLILLCLVLPVATWLGVGGADRVTAAIVMPGAVITLATVWWAGRQRYMRFAAQSLNFSSNESPLPPMSKMHVRATGFFEVGGMRRYLVETSADYTTFETREHCVMAQVPFTRFLLLGTSNRHEVGWWYAFFQPWMIRSVTSGLLYFSLRPRPALQLQVTADNLDEVLYLSFDDEATRSIVLADLQHDAALD